MSYVQSFSFIERLDAVIFKIMSPSIVFNYIIFLVKCSSYFQLGILDVFEPRTADLSPMTPDLGVYARDVQQSIGVNIRNYMKPDRTHSRESFYRPTDPPLIVPLRRDYYRYYHHPGFCSLLSTFFLHFPCYHSYDFNIPPSTRIWWNFLIFLFFQSRISSRSKKKKRKKEGRGGYHGLSWREGVIGDWQKVRSGNRRDAIGEIAILRCTSSANNEISVYVAENDKGNT